MKYGLERQNQRFFVNLDVSWGLKGCTRQRFQFQCRIDLKFFRNLIAMGENYKLVFKKVLIGTFHRKDDIMIRLTLL